MRRRHRTIPPVAFGDASCDQATRRQGFTLPELLVVLVLLGLLLGLAIPRLGAAANRAAVRSAADDLASTFAAARQHAIHRRGAVAVEIDTAAGCVSVRSGEESLARRDLRGMYAVRLAATRDSMAYDARGLGIGAANLSVVLRRGGAVETLFVSRLGRVRR